MCVCVCVCVCMCVCSFNKRHEYCKARAYDICVDLKKIEPQSPIGFHELYRMSMRLYTAVQL